MRFGICTDVKSIQKVADIGFDYIEAKLNGLVALSENEFSKIRDLVEKAPIKVERCCLLLPKTMQVICANYEEDALSEYLYTAFSRMRVLGADLVVFGSGASRKFDASISYQQAFEQLVQVTKGIAKIAKIFDVNIAIEPLNRSETNLINTLAEGAILQQCVADEKVGLLADSYHMSMENENWARIAQVSPLLHTHIARHERRSYPTVASEDIKAFLFELKAVGYEGTMSIEGKSDNWEEDAKVSLALLKNLMR
nr:sugar phosphate isomerase/epimerase family protein [uncultured Sphaerochaeta sp.]